MASEITPHSMNGHAMGMIGLLTFQYLLGEFTSAFIHFPKTQNSKDMWAFVWQHAPLALHAILGTFLLVGTVALFVRSFLYKDRIWLIASFAAGIAVIGAAIAGATFLPTQNDDFSFIMAIFFLFALFSYFWGLYSSKSA